MPKVIQLVAEADNSNCGAEKKRLVLIDSESKPSQVTATYSAAVLFTIAVWIMTSVLNDYLMIREVLTTSFILLCLLIFKRADHDRGKAGFDKEYESK